MKKNIITWNNKLILLIYNKKNANFFIIPSYILICMNWNAFNDNMNNIILANLKVDIHKH